MTQDGPLANTLALTHGTLECENLPKTRRFYKEFLGLSCVREAPRVQFVWREGEWVLVCASSGQPLFAKQGIENRWGLKLATPAEVDAAHAAAVAEREKWEIREITPIRAEPDGTRGFFLQDLDGNWWEIYHRPGRLFDDLFARARAEAGA